MTRAKNCTLRTMALESTPLSHGQWVYSFHCWKSHSIALLLESHRLSSKKCLTCWGDLRCLQWLLPEKQMRRCMRHRTQNVFVWRTIRRLCRIEGSNRDTGGTVLKQCHCKSVLFFDSKKSLRGKSVSNRKSGQTFQWNQLARVSVKLLHETSWTLQLSKTVTSWTTSADRIGLPKVSQEAKYKIAMQTHDTIPTVITNA